MLTVYGVISYPSDTDVTAAVGSQATSADRLAALKSLQSDWLQQIKDLGQLFLLTPVFPLVGAVIGDIFGVRRTNGKTGDSGGMKDEDGGEDSAVPPGQRGMTVEPRDEGQRALPVSPSFTEFNAPT